LGLINLLTFIDKSITGNHCHGPKELERKDKKHKVKLRIKIYNTLGKNLEELEKLPHLGAAVVDHMSVHWKPKIRIP